MNPSDHPPKDQKKMTEEAEYLLSLDELDHLIASEDAEFGSVVETIQSGTLSSETKIDLLDLDELIAEQEARSISARLRRWRKRLVGYYVHISTSLMYMLRTGPPQLGRWLWGHIKKKATRAQESLRQFGFKPLKFKLLVFGFIALCGVCLAIANYVVRRTWSEQKPLFIPSLAAIAESTGTYDPQTETEAFYTNVRAAQNVFSLRKMAVNLSTAGRTSTAMAACELIVEGNSSDVMIEIKVRENEFRDAFMRVIEEFTYEQLDTVVGKQKLLDQLLREANRIVTKGQVLKVYYKNIVIKP